jgi:hypothetical protein
MLARTALAGCSFARGGPLQRTSERPIVAYRARSGLIASHRHSHGQGTFGFNFRRDKSSVFVDFARATGAPLDARD